MPTATHHPDVATAADVVEILHRSPAMRFLAIAYAIEQWVTA